MRPTAHRCVTCPFVSEGSDMTDLLETTEDGIAWLTLNRPDRLNAFSPAMLTGLSEALQRLSGDPEVGAVVITGAGRGFCAGGDVKTMPPAPPRGSRSGSRDCAGCISCRCCCARCPRSSSRW